MTLYGLTSFTFSGGQKFMAMNILFKFALDTEQLYGDDEAAMKSASNELKGLMSYYNANITGMYVDCLQNNKHSAQLTSPLPPS